MLKKYIIAIDAGTTSVRTSLYEIKTKSLIRTFGSKISQNYPEPGWVNQDAEEIWERVRENLSKTIQDIDESEIVGMGITNQRETVVMWDRDTGMPIAPAISWQCKRTEKFCKKLEKDKTIVSTIQKKTGLIINPYFSASKIRWMLDNNYDSVRLYKNGDLCCGTLDSFLVFKLTRGAHFVTEPSNASRTMLYNIHTGEWDDELLRLFKVPRDILPDVVDSNHYIGDVEIDGKTIKLGGILGDQQASLMGQACYDEGNIKNTYGTGSFLLLNIGQTPSVKSSKLITTIAWSINGERTYALEGSIFDAGGCITWLKNKANLIKSASETSDLAYSVESSNDVIFLPAFSGLGAPFWTDTRAEFFNITLDTTRAHMVRAVLEGIAHNVRALVDQMRKDSGVVITDIRVDGGMTANPFFMQYQSDLLNNQILVAKEPESTSMGAAFICGLTFGVFRDFDDLRKRYQIGNIYTPKDIETAQKNYEKWYATVKKIVSQ